jgi:thiamine pyrophosphate-dependent acetolactate synthase large subunit-like protein
MTRTASDVLIEIIHALPSPGSPNTTSTRHCGYAKHTGRLGCCRATSGPGGIHLLNGLYDAKLDGQPVLAINGMQFNDLSDTRSQQDVELDKLHAVSGNLATMACGLPYTIASQIVYPKSTVRRVRG